MSLQKKNQPTSRDASWLETLESVGMSGSGGKRAAWTNSVPVLGSPATGREAGTARYRCNFASNRRAQA